MNGISTGLVMLGAMALIGCGTGSAKIDNSIPETTLELNTVFGWIDTVETTIEDGRLKTKPLEHKRLNIFASGASFDPTEDLRFVSGSDRLQMVLDNNLYGSLGVFVSDLSQLDVGQDYDSGDDAPFQYDVSFGPKELEDGDTVDPEPMLGSGRAMTFTLNELGSGPGDKFKATIRYSVRKEDDDPSGVVTGVVNVVLSGPLVNERLAACNVGSFGSSQVYCD